MLPNSIREQIINVFSELKLVEKVMLFGSRATNRYSETSDIDLAIFGENLTSTDINLIHDQLEENIHTPQKFDVLLYQDIRKAELKKHVDNGVVIYEKE